MTVNNSGEAVRKLAAVLCLDVLPVCIYGSEEMPAGGVSAFEISDRVAGPGMFGYSMFGPGSGKKDV